MMLGQRLQITIQGFSIEEGLQDLSNKPRTCKDNRQRLVGNNRRNSQAFRFYVPADDYGQSLDFIFKVSQSTGIEINRLQSIMVKFRH